MVSKGLKVGDTFNEGASTYIVEQVLTNGNYISRRLTEQEKEEKTAEKRTRTRRKAE